MAIYFWCGIVLIVIGGFVCYVDDFDWRGVIALLWGVFLVAYTLYRGING